MPDIPTPHRPASPEKNEKEFHTGVTGSGVAEGPPPVPAPLPTNLDLVELVRRGTHYTKKDGKHTWIVEKETGNAIGLLSKPPMGIPTTLAPYITPDGRTLWVQDESIPTLDKIPDYRVNPLVVDEICARIVQGESLSEVCETPGMPGYVVFCQWRRNNPWITEALENARRDRAEVLRDKALASALSARDKNDAPAKQLATEAYKWAAGIDNERYNPKAKIDAVLAPTQIIITTGIPERSKDVTDSIKSPTIGVGGVTDELPHRERD